MKTPTGRLARWALQLQSYNLKIEYTPGKSNKVADTLSRPMCNLEELADTIGTVELTFCQENAEKLRHEQLADPEIAKIVNAFETPEDHEILSYWTNRGYILVDGVLYRYAPDTDSEDAQYVVPRGAQAKILQEYHDAPTAGHYGIENTLHPDFIGPACDVIYKITSRNVFNARDISQPT